MRTRQAGQPSPFERLRISLFDPGRGCAPAIKAAASMLGMPKPATLPSIKTAMNSLSRGSRPDVLLVSWVPPDTEALTLCRAIRTPSSSPCPFLPMIIICGQATRESVLAARDCGVDEFLASPFTPKSLGERLRAILFRRRGFVDVPGFFGPDRRRGAMAAMLGVERRCSRSLLIDPGTGSIYIE